MSNPVLVNQIIPESDVVPLTGRVGAEIRGIRPAETYRRRRSRPSTSFS